MILCFLICIYITQLQLDLALTKYLYQPNPLFGGIHYHISEFNFIIIVFFNLKIIMIRVKLVCVHASGTVSVEWFLVCGCTYSHRNPLVTGKSPHLYWYKLCNGVSVMKPKECCFNHRVGRLYM